MMWIFKFSIEMLYYLFKVMQFESSYLRMMLQVIIAKLSEKKLSSYRMWKYKRIKVTRAFSLWILIIFKWFWGNAMYGKKLCNKYENCSLLTWLIYIKHFIQQIIEINYNTIKFWRSLWNLKNAFKTVFYLNYDNYMKIFHASIWKLIKFQLNMNNEAISIYYNFVSQFDSKFDAAGHKLFAKKG